MHRVDPIVHEGMAVQNVRSLRPGHRDDRVLLTKCGGHEHGVEEAKGPGIGLRVCLVGEIVDGDDAVQAAEGEERVDVSGGEQETVPREEGEA